MVVCSRVQIPIQKKQEAIITGSTASGRPASATKEPAQIKGHQSNLECKIQCLCPILWDLFHADGNSYGALRLGIKNGLFRLIHRGTPFSHRGRKGLTRRSRGPSPGPARWVASLSQLSQRISPPRIKRAITVPWRITYGREARVRRASCTLSASIRFRSASLPTAMP